MLGFVTDVVCEVFKAKYLSQLVHNVNFQVFVLLRQLLVFSLCGTLPDIPDIQSPLDSPEISRAKTSGLDAVVPKPGSEICLGMLLHSCLFHKFHAPCSFMSLVFPVDAIPCRIAFERGKERHLCFLAISRGTSGWILLAQEAPVRQQGGIVRIAAPLSGSDVCILTPAASYAI